MFRTSSPNAFNCTMYQISSCHLWEHWLWHDTANEETIISLQLWSNPAFGNGKRGTGIDYVTHHRITSYLQLRKGHLCRFDRCQCSHFNEPLPNLFTSSANRYTLSLNHSFKYIIAICTAWCDGNFYICTTHCVSKSLLICLCKLSAIILN